MNQKRFFVLLITFSVLFLSIGGIAISQENEPEPLPEGPTTIEAIVGSKISYQGMLKESGVPVNGNRDMTFKFYTNSGCSGGALFTVNKNNVPVTEGLFSVALDVNHDHFDGRAFWLVVQVGGTNLGCEEVLPVPYALSLRPGARITENGPGEALYLSNDGSGDGLRSFVDNNVGEAVHAVNDDTGGTGIYGEGGEYGVRGVGETGLKGESAVNGGFGVHGVASATTGATVGVRGVSVSTTTRAAGVYGLVNAASGTTYGVMGENFASGGRGMWGDALGSGETIGVVGTVTSVTGKGVRGWNKGSSGYAVGVEGMSSSPDGIAVAGFQDGYDISDFPTSIIEPGGFFAGRNGAVGFTNNPSGAAMYGYVGVTSGSRVGVRGEVNGTGYGLLTFDNLYVGGACTGCLVTFIAQNSSGETLQLGDVVSVSGVGPKLEGHTTPVLEVQRSSAQDAAVLGVVYSRGELFPAEAGQAEQMGDSIQPVEGDVGPGDYLLVVTSGLAQVRVDPGITGLAPGESLAIANEGGAAAAAAEGTRAELVFGRAMEAEADENGLIWAMINTR